MLRIICIALAALFALAACGPAPDVSSVARPGSTIQTANQDQPIPVETIARDFVGRVVPITEVNGNGMATEWTFDADEFRQIEILEKAVAEKSATIVVFMTTRNNPGPNDDAVQVTGKLRLHYERNGNKWTLKGIENLTFRYTVGLST